jgi:hypothetical protein
MDCKACKKLGSLESKRKLDRVKRKTPEEAKKYREANKVKLAAHRKVKAALVNGELVRAACEVCGNHKSHGHHDDYAKPLTVRWLCSVHHAEWHLTRGEALNAH